MSVDIEFNLGTKSPFSTASSGGLVLFNTQQVGVDKFEQQPLPAPPVSVNLWSNMFNQTEQGRIIGNVVI